MGVFDFVKQGTEEMRLARPASSHAPVCVHAEASLPVWAQLDVAPDEVAVFLRGGRGVGLVGPGRHTVHASKLAFLEGIEPEHGRFPLSLAFVSLTPLARASFAAMLDPIADPSVLVAVRPLLDGDLSVQVTDPIAFVEEHLSGGEHKPLLARRGIIATIDGVRFTLEGRRVPVFAGHAFARRNEHRPSQPPAGAHALACRACGLLGELGKFCASCGALVTEREQCLSCRADLPENARFCLACGARKAAAG